MPSNLREILLQAADTPRTTGWRTSVYDLPPGAFDGSDAYLMRVRFQPSHLSERTRKFLIDNALQNTSGLTPLTLGCDYNFSQPLLAANRVKQFLQVPNQRRTIPSNIAIQIVHKADGVPVATLQKQLGDSGYQEKLASLPDETYRAFFKQLLWLSDHGLPIEAGDDHIWLDETCTPPKFTLIDVCEEQGASRAQRISSIAASNSLADLPLMFFADEKTKDRLVRIAKEVGLPENRHTMRERLNTMRETLPLTRPKQIKETPLDRALSITAAPWAVRQKLQEIERFNVNNAQSRS